MDARHLVPRPHTAKQLGAMTQIGSGNEIRMNVKSTGEV